MELEVRAVPFAAEPAPKASLCQLGDDRVLELWERPPNDQDSDAGVARTQTDRLQDCAGRLAATARAAEKHRVLACLVKLELPRDRKSVVQGKRVDLGG